MTGYEAWTLIMSVLALAVSIYAIWSNKKDSRARATPKFILEPRMQYCDSETGLTEGIFFLLNAGAFASQFEITLLRDLSGPSLWKQIQLVDKERKRRKEWKHESFKRDEASLLSIIFPDPIIPHASLSYYVRVYYTSEIQERFEQHWTIIFDRISPIDLEQDMKVQPSMNVYPSDREKIG